MMKVAIFGSSEINVTQNTIDKVLKIFDPETGFFEGGFDNVSYIISNGYAGSGKIAEHISRLKSKSIMIHNHEDHNDVESRANKLMAKQSDFGVALLGPYKAEHSKIRKIQKIFNKAGKDVIIVDLTKSQ